MKESARLDLILIINITLRKFHIENKEAVVSFFLNAVSKKSGTRWIGGEPGIKEQLLEAYDEGEAAFEALLRRFLDDLH